MATRFYTKSSVDGRAQVPRTQLSTAFHNIAAASQEGRL